MPSESDLTFDQKLLLINSSRRSTYYDRGYPTFKSLNVINNGGFFGEIALVFKSPRTASIIASEDTHLFYFQD